MMDTGLMDEIYVLAEKLEQGDRLNDHEKGLFIELQRDRKADAYRIFSMYTAMLNFSDVYDSVEKHVRRDKERDREALNRRIRSYTAERRRKK